jgi:polyisoprenoid-binding protein YceI
MQVIRSLVLGAVLAAPTLALAAPTGRVFVVDAPRSSLAYHIVHKLHEVDGVSHTFDGKALVQADGAAQLMVRSPVATFGSSDGNRDEHMRETMETTKFPNVTLKGVTKLPTPATFPATLDAVVDAQLDFHGETHDEKIPVKVTFTSADDVHVTGIFDVSLERYHVERPSLLLMKIDDACRITLDLLLHGAKQ